MFVFLNVYEWKISSYFFAFPVWCLCNSLNRVGYCHWILNVKIFIWILLSFCVYTISESSAFSKWDFLDSLSVLPNDYCLIALMYIMQQMVSAEDWPWRLYPNCIILDQFSIFNSCFQEWGYPTKIDLLIPLIYFPGLNNLLMAYDDKSAFALCVFSFAAGPDSEPITFSGKTPVSLWIPFLHNYECIYFLCQLVEIIWISLFPSGY